MSLTTIATLKEYLPELTGTTADTELTNLLNRVEAIVALHLGFPVYDGGTLRSLARKTYTIYLDGPMYSRADVLQLPIRPVVSVTSLHSDIDRVYGSDSLLAGSEYELDGQNGRVILKPLVATNGFDKGFRAIKVVVTAGFDSMPTDLEHAVCVYASALHRSKSSQGKRSISQRDTTTAFDPRTLPIEVKQILYPYRSSTVVL
jgi:hypothetical protein